MRPTIEQKAAEFIARARLDQIPGTIMRVDADIVGNPPLMNDIIEQAFMPSNWARAERQEDALGALYQNFSINEMPLWTRDGGVLDENSELFIQEAVRCLEEFMGEIDSPRYGLRYSLAVCEHLFERLEQESQTTQELIANFEAAHQGAAQERQLKAQEIADFRARGWINRRRQRSILPVLVREYADTLRKSLLIEIGLNARRRVLEISRRARERVDEERRRLNELIGEISDYIADLQGYERELLEFDYNALVPNGLILLDEGDLEGYYQQFKPRLDDAPISDEALAEAILTHLGDEKGKIGRYHGKIRSEVAPALLQISGERFSSIDALDVLTVLERKYVREGIEGYDETELKTQIESRIQEASGFLKINSVDKTRHNKDLTIRCIAVKNGERSRLAKWLGTVTDRRKWNFVDNFSDTEVLFYTSEYAYALYTLTDIDELRKAYEAQPEEKRRNIFHLSPEFADFPEVIPFDQKEAWEIFHEAAAIGLVRNGQGSTWVYNHNGSSEELGDSKPEILKFLAKNQAVLKTMRTGFLDRLRSEGQKDAMAQILTFAEKHKDDSGGVIDKDMLQGILLKLSEGRGWR